MSLIATVDVAAEQFVLGATLAANPDVRVRLERAIPLGGAFVPYVWAANDTIEDVESALQAATDVESYTVLDRTNGQALIRVEWATESDGFLETLVESGATILEAVGEAGNWTIQLRFDNHDEFTVFYRQCADRGISIELKNVHGPGLPEDVVLGAGMTDMQRKTLQVALQRGYFDVPRRINLTDLAAELEISDTAVSQRIRRGITALLVSTLAESDDRTEDR